ncbi:MAG TPA: malto-oligosyltrehalose synthase [candidate division Zixibacteria bacterium]|nr:malto-oligosyltrehalose synthase [candidate division Zixibacteria bacterium]
MTHIPVSTYRIQFNPGFGFRDAERIVDYLSELGITDIYASPIFHARKGSTHGYDIVDPLSLNPDLGEEDDYQNLMQAVKNKGMGWLQDIVPNHMAINSDNKMLMDIFEAGENSKYYEFFEIEWDHPYENMKGKMLVPVLGKLYAECLQVGEIKLKYDRNGLSVNYYELRLPLRISSYPRLFEYNISSLEETLGQDNSEYIKFLGTLHLMRTISSLDGPDSFCHQVQHVKRILWSLYQDNAAVRNFVDENLAFFNSESEDKSGIEALDELIGEQLFRLSFWKVATEEINYRRFFTVNDLICVNIRSKKVMEHTHQLIFKMLDQEKFTGLRIDHIDGLFDPETYLQRLREKTGDAFIVVEKILEEDEQLPSEWPVQGTTGYEFLNHVNGLLCDENNRDRFSKLYYKYARLSQSYDEILHEKKKLIIEKHMAGNIDNLAQYIKHISSHDRYGQDITLYGLKRALEEVIALFPVYRTYINDEFVRETDRKIIKEAIDSALERNPDLGYELKFIEKFLLLKYDDSAPEDEKKRWMHVIMNFQQYTGPVMAKGFEDTILYIYNRLTSLNEVGSNPHRFGISIDNFHEFNRRRTEKFPYSLNTTATHDTKRGEDTRARINVLSEIPTEWEQNLKNWIKINRSRKKKVRQKYAPDYNDEYFFYQTLLGTYTGLEDIEVYKERIKEYVIKAVREAKVHTAWIKPDNEYEEAFLGFVDKVFDRVKNNHFWEEFVPFQKKIAHYGIFNSLSQILLKIACPGVPDFYQGTEYWDLTLVDPDNRRPVDFEKRYSSLENIKQAVDNDLEGLIGRLLDKKQDGRVKQFLIHAILRARNNNRNLFLKGNYMPLECAGEFSNNIVAFGRNLESSFAVVAAPRFLTALIREDELPLGEKVWKDTRIKVPEDFPQNWINMITKERIKSEDNAFSTGRILNSFPAALLISEEES